MPVRKINKTDRVKLVTWIRNGAPLSKGVSLYASMPCNNRLLEALQKNPERYQNELNAHVCALLNIPLSKFESIKKQHHAKKNTPGSMPRKIVRESTTANRARPKPRTFRQEWPFLSRADCPPELKALAADKISAWERYTHNHAKLFDCNNLEECRNIAHEIIKDYKENRLIWEELNYYKKHKTILGIHPVFGHYKRFKKLKEMNVVQLVKEQERTKHRIWRIESEIKKGDKPHLKAEREKRLENTRAELAELNRMLCVNG